MASKGTAGLEERLVRNGSLLNLSESFCHTQGAPGNGRGLCFLPTSLEPQKGQRQGVALDLS